ncbi:MAG: NIPSNAP family protein, partial [Lysobacter sp.]
YTLKPDHGSRFVAAMSAALPMVRASGMDVVAFGRSDHERESFFLIRSYADRAQLIAQQESFYLSDAWRLGPRQALVDCLDDYVNTLVWLSAESVDDLRARNVIEMPQHSPE